MYEPEAVDLLGNQLSPIERRIMALYLELKDLASDPDLAPTTSANIRDALSSLGITVFGLTLEYDHLIDQGC